MKKQIEFITSVNLRNIPENSLLAFDVNVSSRDIGRLAKLGYKIVCCAKEGETDESFLERAWKSGATIVFARDSDIGNIIEKMNYNEMRWQYWN